MTAPRVAVTRLEPPLRPGRCLAIAEVYAPELEVTIRGVMVMRTLDGMEVRLPRLMDATGQVVFPVSVSRHLGVALRDEVLAAVERMGWG